MSLPHLWTTESTHMPNPVAEFLRILTRIRGLTPPRSPRPHSVAGFVRIRRLGRCVARSLTTSATWLFILSMALLAGCGRRQPPQGAQASPPTSQGQGASLLPPIELAQPTQRLGTAIVVLIDTSGSMAEPIRDLTGRPQPKNVIARDALSRIIQVTAEWNKKHADSTLYLGIINFSGVASTVLPMTPFDAAKAQAAIQTIPPPGGGTAIGLALEEGFKKLYETGCIRKHVVCITDGENTVGTPPDLMGRQLFAQTKGDVELHFVAFDVSSSSFAFLKNVNGNIHEAADGAQLQSHLVDLYEKRILLEAMPAEKE